MQICFIWELENMWINGLKKCEHKKIMFLEIEYVLSHTYI
jgi:hypothetical protein